MKPVTDLVQQGRILVADGAWGTTLQSRGLKPGDCPELWNVDHREDILSVALSYIEAGSDLIETNTFGGNRIRLSCCGYGDRTVELNVAAAEIACEAAGDKGIVLGSIGPTGKFVLAGDVTTDDLYDVFTEQVKALESGGVQVALIETMQAIDEATIAISAVRENTDLEIACTFTFEKLPNGKYKTMMGHSPADCALAAKKAGADVIGTNCGDGIDAMISIVKELRTAEPVLPIIVQPNAGIPELTEEGLVYPEDPQYMADRVELLLKAGANIVGGCCGTKPEHIRAISKVVRQYL